MIDCFFKVFAKIDYTPSANRMPIPAKTAKAMIASRMVPYLFMVFVPSTILILFLKLIDL